MDILKNPQGEVRDGWKAGGFVLVFAALVALINVTFKFLLHLHHVGMLVNVILSTAMGLAAAWICLAIEKKPLSDIGYRLNGRWAKDLSWGVLGGAGIMLLTALAAMGAGGFHWVRGAAGLQAVGAGALLFILVGFNEETLFRGYLFQRLVGGMGQWPAQILMALFFGLAHWGNPGMVGATKVWATVNIALAAILLGLCYLKTKSLALPIGVHIGWNFTQGNVLGFGVSGTTDAQGLLQPVFHGKAEWITGGAFGLEASLPCVIVCGAAIVALLLWKGRASGDPSTVPAS
ncbi:MAG TPA: type II CAAX endopeptidase family protein [Holophagaceae bacterium]|nr:type II CAAX endopeptidase family protein [Holophagaceae bacterium]